MKTPTEEFTQDAYRSHANADFGRACYYCRVGALVSLCLVATFCAFCWHSVETFGQRARALMTRERLDERQVCDHALAVDSHALSDSDELNGRLDALYPSDLKFGWQTQRSENTVETVASQPIAPRATLGDYQSESFDNVPAPPVAPSDDFDALAESDALASLESNLVDASAVDPLANALVATPDPASSTDDATLYGDLNLPSSVSNNEYIVGYNDSVNIVTEQFASSESVLDNSVDPSDSVASNDSLASDENVGLVDDPLDLNRLAQEFEASQADLAELTASPPVADATVAPVDNSALSEALASSAPLVAAAPVESDAFDDTPAPQVSSRARLTNQLVQSPAPTQWDEPQSQQLQSQPNLQVTVDNATTSEQLALELTQLDPIVRPTDELYDSLVGVDSEETLPPAPGAFSHQPDDATPALAMNYDALDPYAQTDPVVAPQEALGFHVVENQGETPAETPATQPVEYDSIVEAQPQPVHAPSGFAFQNAHGYIESPSYFSRAADILGGPYEYSQRNFARALQIIDPEEAYAPSSFARAAGLLDDEQSAQEQAQPQTSNDSNVRSIGYLQRANRAESRQSVSQAGYVQSTTLGRPATLRQLEEPRQSADDDLWQTRDNETPQEQVERMLEILKARNVSAARVERWSRTSWRASGVISSSDGAAYVEAFGDTPGHATQAFVQKTSNR